VEKVRDDGISCDPGEPQGPLTMPGRVGARSTPSFTIKGKRVGYRVRSVHPFGQLFRGEVGVRGPPPTPSYHYPLSLGRVPVHPKMI
jgi:hypothetical protein